MVRQTAGTVLGEIHVCIFDLFIQGWGATQRGLSLLRSRKKGRAEGLNKVSNALFEKATQGNVTAMIYYLKVRDRANWGENQPEPLREIPPMQIVVDSRAVEISPTP